MLGHLSIKEAIFINLVKSYVFAVSAWMRKDKMTKQNKSKITKSQKTSLFFSFYRCCKSQGFGTFDWETLHIEWDSVQSCVCCGCWATLEASSRLLIRTLLPHKRKVAQKPQANFKKYVLVGKQWAHWCHGAGDMPGKCFWLGRVLQVWHLNYNLVSLKGLRGERGADGFPGKPGPKVTWLTLPRNTLSLCLLCYLFRKPPC